MHLLILNQPSGFPCDFFFAFYNCQKVFDTETSDDPSLFSFPETFVVAF